MMLVCYAGSYATVVQKVMSKSQYWYSVVMSGTRHQGEGYAHRAVDRKRTPAS